MKIQDDWDASSCTVTSYTETSTQCDCVLNWSNTRKLAAYNQDKHFLKGGRLHVASVIEKISNESKSNFEAFTKVNTYEVKQNYVVFAVQGSIFFGMPIFSIFNYLLYRWRRNHDKRTNSNLNFVEKPTNTKKGRFYHHGDVHNFFRSKWAEETDWGYLIMDVDKTLSDKLLRCAQLMCDLFILMFWMATFSTSLANYSSGSSAHHYTIKMLNSDEQIASIQEHIFVTCFSMIMMGPSFLFTRLVFSNSVKLKFPQRAENDKIDEDGHSINTSDSQKPRSPSAVILDIRESDDEVPVTLYFLCCF